MGQVESAVAASFLGVATDLLGGYIGHQAASLSSERIVRHGRRAQLQ
jgi:hypothetical protein